LRPKIGRLLFAHPMKRELFFFKSFFFWTSELHISQAFRLGLLYWASESYWAGLTGRRSCPLHLVRTGRTRHIFQIFFKIPRIYSNILEYFLVGQAWRSIGCNEQAGGRASKQPCFRQQQAHQIPTLYGPMMNLRSKFIFHVFFEELMYAATWKNCGRTGCQTRILLCPKILGFSPFFQFLFLFMVLHDVIFNVTTPIWMQRL
jgi:hypothetical protein